MHTRSAIISSVTFVLLINVIPGTPYAQTIEKGIYGEDDRTEVYNAEDPLMEQIARSSVAVMVDPRNISKIDDSVVLSGPTFETAKNLCPSERFASQTSFGTCSGTLIADDLILTAGHCVKSRSDCSGYHWVFNAYYTAEGQRKEITPDDVFQCKEVVESVYEDPSGELYDFAIVQLARPATPEFTPVSVRTKRAALPTGIGVTLIGFGAGIPMKIDSGANITANREEKLDYFTTNSDALQGNSGSGVFNDNGLLIGILVAGTNDYVYDQDADCRRVARFKNFEEGEYSAYAFRAIDALCNTTERNNYALCADRCGNNFCEPGEWNATCKDCDTEGPKCGDGICEEPEAIWNCRPDCGETFPPKAWTCDEELYASNGACDCGCGFVDPDCADRSATITGCETDEIADMCNISGECALEAQSCGNGLCQQGETNENCAIDCANGNSTYVASGGSCSTTNGGLNENLPGLLFVMLGMVAISRRKRL